jgi:hypothetical protein
MALVETASGRWFPVFAFFSGISNQIDVLEISPLIPPAHDSLHDPGPGYVCREEAIEACRSWCEAVALTEYWRVLAACTEVYPERNAWYLDEITQLAGGDTPRLHCGISVHAMVLARRTTGIEVMTATGDTPDEAIEALYQCVCEWSRMLQAAACARSTPPIS